MKNGLDAVLADGFFIDGKGDSTDNFVTEGQKSVISKKNISQKDIDRAHTTLCYTSPGPFFGIITPLRIP